MSDISSGQTSSRTTSCGIAYSEAEERTVERINAVSQRVHDAQREIGKIVDDIVAVKGGPVYGDRTLDRLSKHPKLECSREHLRRCWQFYRLVVTAQVPARSGWAPERIGPSQSSQHKA